jgi:hypothetical protein
MKRMGTLRESLIILKNFLRFHQIEWFDLTCTPLIEKTRNVWKDPAVWKLKPVTLNGNNWEKKRALGVDIFRPSPFVWRGQEGVNHACGPVRHIDSISSRRERPAYQPNAERLFFLFFPQLSTDVFYYTRMERLIENASLIHLIPQQQQQQLCSF